MLVDNSAFVYRMETIRSTSHISSKANCDHYRCPEVLWRENPCEGWRGWGTAVSPTQRKKGNKRKMEVPPAGPHLQHKLQIPIMEFLIQFPRILCSHQARCFSPEASPFFILVIETKTPPKTRT